MLALDEHQNKVEMLELFVCTLYIVDNMYNISNQLILITIKNLLRYLRFNFIDTDLTPKLWYWISCIFHTVLLMQDPSVFSGELNAKALLLLP